MSHLLARIMLALLMLPLAAVLYTGTAALMLEFSMRSGRMNDTVAFLVADLVSAAFVAMYWFWLWRRTICWTRQRVEMTIGTVVGALVCGVIVGMMGVPVDASFGAFLGGVVSILVWLFLTVLVWRETAEERVARVRVRSGLTVVCPACGYNMTGLNVATCPECGATFSLDELIASQPEHEQGEIEGGDDA